MNGGREVRGRSGTWASANLEPLVLQNLLDGNFLSLLRPPHKLCLEHDTKRPIADDFAVGVGKILCLARLAIRGNYLDDFVRVVDG